MKYVPAIAMTAALALTASADAASNYHKRHARHTRAPVVVAPAPSWGFSPVRPMGPPDPYGCYEEESGGRRIPCGVGGH
jgi:hypothetical protein